MKHFLLMVYTLMGGSITALWFTVLIRIEGKVQIYQEIESAPVSLIYVLCEEIKFFLTIPSLLISIFEFPKLTPPPFSVQPSKKGLVCQPLTQQNDGVGLAEICCVDRKYYVVVS